VFSWYFSVGRLGVNFTAESVSRRTTVNDQAAESITSPALTAAKACPRILFIVDLPNWAHDFKTQNLARVLGKDFDIRKRYQAEVTPDDLNQADLIVVYYWLQLRAMKTLLPWFKLNRDKLLVGICSNWELERRLRRPGLRVLRKWARAVFVNNLSLYREYQPAFDVPVFYTPNGVDTGFYHPPLNAEPSSVLRVGWAGSLSNREPGYRGYQELVLPAVKALDGAELIAAVREDKWRSPDEMREFYHSLDVYVCASRTEGTPNPCLEAAACGVPLITTRVGNMPELVRHGSNGFFIRHERKDLTEKLRTLRDSPALRLSLRAHLHEDIQLWDWSIRAQAYRKMFEEMLARQSAAAPLSIIDAIPPPLSCPTWVPENVQVKAGLLQKAQASLSSLPPGFFSKHREVEVTIVMLSHGRLDMTLNAIRALRDNVKIPFKLLLIDNGSGTEVQDILTKICSEYDFIELLLLSENLGLGGGRVYSLAHVGTEHLLFLDNDVEVFPGMVEHLLSSLELNPGIVAATSKVVLPDGSVQFCGGDYWIKGGVLFYKLLEAGKRFDKSVRANSGVCKWLSGGATIFRKAALMKQGLDPAMGAYYDDLEWCYRLNQLGEGHFYRCVEALALHYYQSKLPSQTASASEKRSYSIRYVETIAHFYQNHGQVIQSLFTFVPELGLPSSRRSVASARVFLELVNARGSDWVLEKWEQGELAPLFPRRSISAQVARKARAAVRTLRAAAGRKPAP
jgi:glycosyltransferase involved in cell wall biosynthesis/GT2 family glycosyltransferase